MRLRHSILWLLSWCAACSEPEVPVSIASEPSASATVAPEPPPPPIALAWTRADASIDSLPHIESLADWQRLAARSDEHAVARTEVVKVLYDRARDELHFCQSERWPLHYEFLLNLHPEEAARYPAMRDFMTRNYLRDDRAYVMGSIVHFMDADLWAFELGPADTLAIAEITRMLERIAARTYFGEALRFHPRSARQIEQASRAGLSTLDSEALWRGVRYQPITVGEATGIVRFVEGPLSEANLHGDEILVVRETPDDLPRVRALVTAELQTPLAHVAVLSESRGTPNMALVGVDAEATWRAFEGRLAHLVVDARQYTLTAVDRDDTATEHAARNIAPADRGAMALLALDGLGPDDVSRAGTKACQLAAVRRLGLPTADGFVVPMARALAHLDRYAPDRAAVIESARSTPSERAALLSALRTRIQEGAIDEALLDELERRAIALGSRRVLLRSSTNAEDLAGFSGAGLYDSVAADPRDRVSLARALGQVWASIDTLRGFEERELAGIDHLAVAMAVLVQPFLEPVRAMGVAVTENPFSGHRAGFLVNLAAPSSSVTATVDARPESWLLYLHSSAELLGTASGATESLLVASAARPLRDQLARLHEGMIAAWRAQGIEARAVDAELAILQGGSVVFLQARPYGVVRRD